MKINQSSPPVGATVSSPSSAGTSQSKPAAKAAAPDLQSNLVRRALADSSDVDLAKVQQLKRAIAEGRLPLDPAALAEAVTGLHRR